MLTLRIFVVFAFAHVTSNFVRQANAVIAGDLRRDLAMDPSDLGWMTSLFLLAFAAAQVPLGVALDRYGARRVVPTLMAVAVLGAVAFALGRDVATLTAARALMGLGTAGILMGGLKALSGGLSPRRFASVSGALVAVGSSGGLLAATPLALAADAFGWRATFLGAAGALASAAVLVAVGGRAAPVPTPAHAEGPDGGFEALFTSPTFLRASFLGLATTGVAFAYQGLWAGPYLTEAIGLARVPTGNVLLAFAVGASAGYLVLGALAERVGVGRVAGLAGAVFTATQLALAFAPAAGGGRLAALFVLLGVAGAASGLLYALVRSHFPPSLTGRAVTGVNLFVFAGGFAVQGLLGVWLDAGLGGHASSFLLTAGLGAVATVVFLPEARGAA